MRHFFGIILFSIVFLSCKDSKYPVLSEGLWLAELEVMNHEILPFNFKLTRSEADNYTMEIYNADETIRIDEIEIHGDSIDIRFPVFEGYVSGTFTEKSIQGEFIKESLDRIVPFHAVYGQTNRFMTGKPSRINISGIWETEFSPGTEDRYMAKGIFAQNGHKVTGTFRTTTGDYRYLEGVVAGDSLKLSAFDGAHAFLFTAKATDSSLSGTFYSGNHFKEPFIGRRNESFELPDADSLTFLKKGHEKLAFSFPNSDGKSISLSDNRFKDKVVIVQILGSWCPNCLDETKFYVDYKKNKNPKDLEIVGLAFEYAKTEEGAFKGIERLKERIGVEYPILLAQYGTYDKTKAQEKLPMLNHVLSYPTSIYIDKKGKVRKIHTGFNGPATGEKFMEFKEEFDRFVTQLMRE